MDETVVHEVIHNDEFEHPKFFQQIFKLLEDMRVLNFIMSERPSTTNAIRKRKAIRLNFTQTQINVYKTKTTFTDLLF